MIEPLMKSTIADPIDDKPQASGKYGRAWRVNVEAVRALPRPDGLAGADMAGIAAWIVEAPWAHPFWHSYQLSVIHLRDLPGLPPAHRYFPEATHEIILQALDPQGLRLPLIKGTARWGEHGATRPLSPANFIAQFIADDDQHAAAIPWVPVNRICAGDLSPDTDFRLQWIALFGANAMPQAYRLGPDVPLWRDFRGGKVPG